MAVFRGIAKFLLQWEREALQNGGKAVFDREFIKQHTIGIDDYLAEVDATAWEHITEQSGLDLSEIEMVASMYRRAERALSAQNSLFSNADIWQFPIEKGC